MRVLFVLHYDVPGIGLAGDHVVHCPDGSCYLVRALAPDVIHACLPGALAHAPSGARPPPRPTPGLRLVK